MSASKDKSPFKDATIRTLRLKPVTTVVASTTCSDAIEIMRDKGFDQLPVLASNSPSKRRLVGLVTLGNLLSWISQGRASPSAAVSEVMFSFSKIPEVVTDPRDIGLVSLPPKTKADDGTNESREDNDGSGGALEVANAEMDRHGKGQKHKFVEITLDTPLRALSRFFEWNSAAVVTEREGEEGGWMKPVAVVTKVDLLGWLVRQGKMNGSS